MLSMPKIGWTSLSVITDPPGLTVGVFPLEVDIANAPIIRDQLVFLLEVGSTPLVLDLTQTEFCDCAGVGAIVGVERRAIALRTPICLVLPADGIVTRVAELTGLTRRLRVATGLTSARTLLLAPPDAEGSLSPGGSGPA